jgi:hypothetical protein
MRPKEGERMRRSLAIAIGLVVVLLVGTAPAADSINVRVIGHYASLVRGWVDGGWDVSGDYAYFAGNGAFLVLSVADPAHPALVGSCDWDTMVTGLEVVDDFVYVTNADTAHGLRVVSVADPAHPVEVGHCHVPGIPMGVAVSGSYAYVVCDSYGLRIISVADPTNPTEVGYCDTPGSANGVKVVGDYAYVADFEGGLRIFSVADPAHPVEVGCYPSGMPRTVQVSGDHAYLGCSDRTLRVISITDPAHPVEVGCLDSVDYIQGLEIAGNLAYAASSISNEGRLRVISIADPTHLAEVGYYALNACLSADTGRGFVYVGTYDGRFDSSYVGVWILQFYGGGGVEERLSAEVPIAKHLPAVVRGVLIIGDRRQKTGDRAELLDASGRKVLDLEPGANDVSALAPGVYFVVTPSHFPSPPEGERAGERRRHATVAKVIVAE